MSLGTLTMPRKKPEKVVRYGEAKPIVVAIRGSAEFKDWLERYAHHNRSTVAQVVERALAVLSSRDGFEQPPPR